jgi:hypothetical protein
MVCVTFTTNVNVHLKDLDIHAFTIYYKEISTHVYCMSVNSQQRMHEAFGASVFFTQKPRPALSVTHSSLICT